MQAVLVYICKYPSVGRSGSFLQFARAAAKITIIFRGHTIQQDPGPVDMQIRLGTNLELVLQLLVNKCLHRSQLD